MCVTCLCQQSKWQGQGQRQASRLAVASPFSRHGARLRIAMVPPHGYLEKVLGQRRMADPRGSSGAGH